MKIDLNMLFEIFKAVMLLFFGGAVNRLYERHPKLIAYYESVSAFKGVNQETQEPLDVFTHSVILRNSGNLPATNIRLHHKTLPYFNIYPEISHSVEELNNGAKDIVIPTMVPKEQITISYLYFPPLTYAQTNAGIKSDQGFAKQIDVLLQPKLKKWQLWSIWTVFLIGIVSAIYILIIFGSYLFSFF